MTRYTNVGRKRTHLDAGFSGDKQDIEGEPAVVEPAEQTQPAKKRKHTKHKQPTEGEETPAVAPVEEEQKVEDSEVKNAYMNRDENRKKEAFRTAQSEKRRESRIQDKLANTTCFACREKGHAARDCPNIETGGGKKAKGKSSAVICYRCGSEKHTLSRCRKPEDPDNHLPYASCFVCSGKGHIASSCPQNQNKGVYPNGGSCKLCNETSHLARNCPSRRPDTIGTTVFVGTGNSAGADEDDFHAFKRVNAEVDMEEREEAKAMRKADIKMGVVSKTVKSFAPVSSKRKVVVF